MKAQIQWNPLKSKYQLVANGRILVSSKKLEYLEYLMRERTHKAIVKAGVKSYTIVSRKPNTIVATDLQGAVVGEPEFSINERFGFMAELIGMVINKTAKSILITGEGGVGKTFEVLDCLKKAGKVDFRSVMPTLEDLIAPTDDEPEIKEKAIALMNRPTGDYIVIKGHI